MSDNSTPTSSTATIPPGGGANLTDLEPDGRKALVGWLRSHPEVARRWHADLLEDPAWNPGR